MKEKLLQAIEDGRAHEADLVALVVDEPADSAGRWNAKDHLAHLSWWRWRSAQTLDAVRTGAEPPPALPDDDAITNARIYAEVKDRPAKDVKADAARSWDSLSRAIRESSDDDLSRPHPREPKSQVWEVVPGAVGHAGTHVWSWYMDIGETERGLDGARWAADMEGRFFDKPEQLASARYNLACAYARARRPGEAVPLLRQSFDADPALIELVRKDTDLDPIRDDDELKALLAT